MTAGSGLRLLLQAFEPMPGNAGVMGGVLGIAVAEVILHRAQLAPLIRKLIAAAVTQHVRPHLGDGDLGKTRWRHAARDRALPLDRRCPVGRANGAHLGSPAIGARRRARLGGPLAVRRSRH